MSTLSLIRRSLATAALLAITSMTSVVAHAQEPAAVPVKDFDVYVDLPTAFAFIKLPTGWKFIGKLDASQLKQLPPGTLTALLPPEEESATRMAEAATPAVPAARPVMLARSTMASTLK